MPSLVYGTAHTCGSGATRMIYNKAWIDRQRSVPVRPCCTGCGAAALHAAPPARSRQQSTHRSVCMAQSSGQQLWTPGGSEASAVQSAAERLAAFCDAFPELPDEVQGALATRLPGILAAPHAETREKLERIGQLAGSLPLETAARLVAKAPALWNRSPEAAALKVSSLASELRVTPEAAAAFLISQPQLTSISMPGVVQERVEALSAALGVTDSQAVAMVGRQPMLWVVPPRDVRCSVPALAGRLGVSSDAAARLVERMPVLLALEQDVICLSVSAAAAASGLGEDVICDLVARHPPLAAVDGGMLASALESLGRELWEGGPEAAARLVLRQPTLLLTAPANAAAAAELLAEVLGADIQEGLRVLCDQPWLLYDHTHESLTTRLTQLGALFGGGAAEGRELALQQPALLALSPATVGATLAALEQQLGQGAADVLPLLLSDPGGAVVMGYLGGSAVGARLAEAWANQLGMAPGAVGALISAQPALLEVPPNVLKARLEGLGALLEAPAPAVAQLVLKHAALAAVPPNATITRCKNLATALGCSMARAGELIAKAPAVLAIPTEQLKAARIEAAAKAAAEGVSARDGQASVGGPLHERLLDVCAAYEFFTAQWLAASAKQRSPAKETSFSMLHGGTGGR